MKLIDLLSLINENSNVLLIDISYEIVSGYNGKDSIDSKYNNCKVCEIIHATNAIYVMIKLNRKEDI